MRSEGEVVKWSKSGNTDGSAGDDGLAGEREREWQSGWEVRGNEWVSGQSVVSSALLQGPICSGRPGQGKSRTWTWAWSGPGTASQLQPVSAGRSTSGRWY